MRVRATGLPVLLLGALLCTGAQAATVALVIDDLGYNRERARRALALPPPIIAAVLPESPHAGLIARSAARAGIDVLVHLPMQGHANRFSPGSLHAGLSQRQLRDRLQSALDAVPGAIGVNNHMGSVLTADRGAMRMLMREIRGVSRDLVFLDSRTTADTVAEAMAVETGIGTTSRDVFLDHDRAPAAIERQLHRWLRRAQTRGCALAIGHPHPATLEALERLLPRMRGVRRVGLREYVEICGVPAVHTPRVASHAVPEGARAEERGTRNQE